MASVIEHASTSRTASSHRPPATPPRPAHAAADAGRAPTRPPPAARCAARSPSSNASWPRPPPEPRPRTASQWSTATPGLAGPRLLGLGELERLRDDLAERLHEVRVVHAERAAREALKRDQLAALLRDPAEPPASSASPVATSASPAAAPGSRAPPQPDRHARRLVARQDLLRLPSSRPTT